MGLTNTELCFRLIDKNEDGILERTEITDIVKWFLAAAMYHPIASQYLKGIDIASPEADEAVKFIADDLFQYAGDMITDSGQHIKAITFVGFRSWLTNFMLIMMENNTDHQLEFDGIALPADTNTTTLDESGISTETGSSNNSSSTITETSFAPNNDTSSSSSTTDNIEQQQQSLPSVTEQVSVKNNPEPVNIVTSSEEDIIIPNPLPTMTVDEEEPEETTTTTTSTASDASTNEKNQNESTTTTTMISDPTPPPVTTVANEEVVNATTTITETRTLVPVES